MTSASHFIAAEGGATGSSPFCTYSMGRAMRRWLLEARRSTGALCFFRTSSAMTTYQPSLQPAQRSLTSGCLAGLKI